MTVVSRNHPAAFIALGQVVVTASVNDRIADSSVFAKFVMDSIKRYTRCDWGSLCEEDVAMNDHAALQGGERIIAKYDSPGPFDNIYIITEWDHSYTTIMFTYEY